MKMASQICILLLVLGASAMRAADAKTEEAAIRAEIAAGRETPTDDEIFWSGAFRRPFIRPEKGEAFPDEDFSKRLNEKSTTDVQRIEVAASGDLAYEFSYGTIEYDRAGTPPQHVAFKLALLRVWKKVDGQWKVAALFARPLDVPFAGSEPAEAK
jgi:ketosteroid isomerase-like protein